MVIFHSYVELPEGMFRQTQVLLVGLKKTTMNIPVVFQIFLVPN